MSDELLDLISMIRHTRESVKMLLYDIIWNIISISVFRFFFALKKKKQAKLFMNFNEAYIPSVGSNTGIEDCNNPIGTVENDWKQFLNKR